jgi:hypothetical protein
LDAGAHIKPDAGAAAYLDRNISFDGRLSIPMLTMHTTGDGLVVPQNESAYAEMVALAGRRDMLRQLFVHRAGHCAFTTAEVLAAFQQLVKRLDTGKWDDAALDPATMNSQASAEGSAANQMLGLRLPPAFVAYTPARFPRPFGKGSTIPG